VLAPTGTIGFMMDCDTTGIEPDLALVKYKKLVGGGMIKIVNNTLPTALFKLGYTSDQTNAIVNFIDATGTIEGAPHIKDDHIAIFDCSFKPSKGTRFIAYTGHLRMMSAVQPFISGAISKTVNMPETATIEQIMEAYMEAWRLGLKAVAIYRDGCKKSQPLVLSKEVAEKVSEKINVRVAAASAPVTEEEDLNGPPRAVRHKLPPERMSITHKFNIAGHEGYITVGTYPNHQPGEIFITMAKEGSTVSGLMDSFALGVSIALQHGVPLKLLCEKFEHTRFEPSGWSHNPDIGYAKSIMDYIFRWLHLRFLTGQQQPLFPGMHLPSPVAVNTPDTNGNGGNGGSYENGASSAQMTLDSGGQSKINNQKSEISQHAADALSEVIDLGDAPSCSFCGAIMVRNGSCYKCMSCGSTSGCS
jgi:ribonucleoside-diphosphate reductase alpha chain